MPALYSFDVSETHPYIIESLRYLAVPIDSVYEDEINAQIHSERNLETIKESIRAKGQDQPIVVRKADMVVTKGNGRLVAMRRLGYTHIAAVIVDESRISAVERGLADNRASALSQADDEILAFLMQEVSAAEGMLIGWSDPEIDRIIANIDEDEVAGELGASRPEEQAKLENGKMSHGERVGAVELKAEDFQKFENTCPRCSFGWTA
jgi:ParB-like chromosome segregation protein Spo0J